MMTPESPNDGACLRYFKVYDEPESPSKGACLRYMLNRFANEGACCRDMNDESAKLAC